MQNKQTILQRGLTIEGLEIKLPQTLGRLNANTIRNCLMRSMIEERIGI